MSRIDVTKPRQWRFDELVRGAKSGNPSVDAILDDRTSQRALDLNTARQRIHAGYLIDSVPTGPIPDLRPEEARDALQMVEAVVRGIVDWLGRHPAPWAGLAGLRWVQTVRRTHAPRHPAASSTLSTIRSARLIPRLGGRRRPGHPGDPARHRRAGCGSHGWSGPDRRVR
jgi:hypothetical protein